MSKNKTIPNFKLFEFKASTLIFFMFYFYFFILEFITCKIPKLFKKLIEFKIKIKYINFYDKKQKEFIDFPYFMCKPF